VADTEQAAGSTDDALVSTLSSPAIFVPDGALKRPEALGGPTRRKVKVDEKARLHPVTLQFDDEEAERAYRAYFWDVHKKYAQRGYIFLMGLLMLFGILDFFFFPDHAIDLWLVRMVMLPGLLALIPLLYTERFRGVMRQNLQEVLLASGFWIMSGFGVMGWIIVDGADLNGTVFGGLVYMLSTLFIYIIIRLRVVYAAILGGSFFVIGIISLLQEGVTDFILLSFAFIGAGTNFVGIWAGYTIERYLRLMWHSLQRVAIEQDKVERLLHNILPEEIADRLKESEEAIADGFESVTVLFADIVGFTPLSAQLEPKELVGLLDQIFTEFDRLAEKYGVEKIKTIGDAYMVAAGIPTPREDHAEAAAKMALDMRNVIKRVSKQRGGTLEVRIGLHSGPVVAGVIGQRKFIYDLWGDTVNTASRMEAHGMPGAIQLSEETRALLDNASAKKRFKIESRGTVDIKGKGPMTTFWLK